MFISRWLEAHIKHIRQSTVMKKINLMVEKVIYKINQRKNSDLKMVDAVVKANRVYIHKLKCVVIIVV